MKYEKLHPAKVSPTIEQQEAIRISGEKDCDFISRLSKEHQKKRRIIELSDLPSDATLINFA